MKIYIAYFYLETLVAPLLPYPIRYSWKKLNKLIEEYFKIEGLPN